MIHSRTGWDEESAWSSGGSYLYAISLERGATFGIGALGKHRLGKGIYVYIGSARKGIGSRVDRHRRLSRLKRGSLRWHIDFLLVHRHALFLEAYPFPGVDECALSRAVAREPGVTVPVPGFGSSDCRSGCRAHFYRLPLPHHGSIARFAAEILRKLPGDHT